MNDSQAPANSWQPYQPAHDRPWNEYRVVHLHRRAAWGATWQEIERDLTDGPIAALNRLLAPPAPEEGVDDLTQDLAARGVARQDVNLLQAAWIMRMWHGRDPLGEQLTLLWHNHFATSNVKVRDCALMWRQHETLRRHSRGSFRELLHALLRDPALLIWLDADSNRTQHPNENLARELMELFTLGEGHYSEDDVREAARALTGWRVEAGIARFDPSEHDKSTKTILGQKGSFDLDDLLEILIEHPATARRLAWRICDHFFGPQNCPETAVEKLATRLRATRLQIDDAIATLLRSEIFFDSRIVGTRIRSPASYIVATARALERHHFGLSPEVAALWMHVMGQNLFKPPGVAGWPGGRSWLSAAAMIERGRFASRLSAGTLYPTATPVDIQELAKRYDRAEVAVDFTSRLLFGELVDIGHDRDALPRLLVSAKAQFD